MNRERLLRDIEQLIKAARELQQANRDREREKIETAFALIEFIVEDIEEDILGEDDD